MDKPELRDYLSAYIAERGLSPRGGESYISAVNSLAGVCGGVDAVLAVDDAGVEEWIGSARLSTCSKANYLSRLRLFFSFLVREGVVGRNPFEGIDVPGRERAWSQRLEQRNAEFNRKAAENAARFTAFGLLEDFSDLKRHSRGTRLGYRTSLWKLSDCVGGPDEVLFAMPEDVGPWLEEVTTSEYHRVRIFSQMRAFFDFAVERGAAPGNPFRGVERPRYSRDREWDDRLEPTDLIRMIECARSAATTVSGQMTYAIACLVIYNGMSKEALRLADAGDYRKTTRDGAVLMAGGRPSLLNAETERALDGYLSYRWDLQPEDPLFASTLGPNKGGRFASQTAVSNRVRDLAAAAGVDLKGKRLLSSLVIEALHEGLTPGQAAEFYRLSPGNRHVRAMAPEAQLAAALSPQSRVELGLVTRADVTRGIAARADLAAALEADPGAELFDVVVSYDGTVRFEPRPARNEREPRPRILRGQSPR